MTQILHTTKEKHTHSGMVHFILSHSYTVFFVAVLLGVTLNIYLPIDIFNSLIYKYGGLLLIALGSILIYWAQSASSATKKEMLETKTVRDFAKGPYKYSRNPTHIGLTIMTLGLAFLINSVFSILLVILASVITKSFFLKEEECLLLEMYGSPYADYKKKVRTWI